MAIRIECHNGYFGQVYISANGAEFVERGQDFKLVDIAVDVDTDEIIYTVECLRLGKPTRFSIPKKHAIDKKKLLEYANMGSLTNLRLKHRRYSGELSIFTKFPVPRRIY